MKLSKEYFDLKDSEATVYVNDGRTFLAGPDAGLYDIIMVDAYHDITIPFHMSTREFFSEVKEHLKPGGVILININMRSEKSSEIVDYLSQTLKTDMNCVYKCSVPYTTNTIVFSSDNPDCLNNFRANMAELDSESPLLPIAKNINENQQEVKDTEYVFTDDLAPVEVLGQKVLNDIVQDSLTYFKQELGTSDNGVLDIFKLISGS